MGGGQSNPQENSSAVEETEVQVENFSPRIKNGILDSISKLWPIRDQTDFVVTIENTQIHCHRFILCACSNYFTDLLHHRHGGIHENTVTFTSFSKATFETILEALYTGRNVVTSNNVIDLWLACHQLGINFLGDVCEDFILKLLTVNNIGIIYKNALVTRSEKILQATFKMMMQNFDVFRECNDFLELSFDTLLKLIASHDLVVTTEDIVVDAILEWVNYQPSGHLTESNTVDRKEYLGKLFAVARLPLVSSHCLVMLMACETVVRHREAKEALDRAMVYQLPTGQRHGQWPSSALHRKNSQLRNVIIAGHADGRMSALSVTDLETWHHCKAFSGFDSSYITLTAFDNTLYAFASPRSCCVLQLYRVSFNRQTEVTFSALQNKVNAKANVSGQLFVLEESEWKKVTEVSGTEHILVAHGCAVYFLHPVTKKVQKLGLPFTGTAAISLDNVPADGFIRAAIAFEKSILVFCQQLENSTETTVHCLDTVRRTWSRLNNLIGQADIVIFKDETSTYLLQGSGEVHKIISTKSGQENFRFIGKLWDFQWKICGCFSVRNTLYICGNQPDLALAGDNTVTSSEAQDEVVFVNHGQNSCLAGVFDSVKYISGRFDYFQPIILHNKYQLPLNCVW